MIRSSSSTRVSDTKTQSLSTSPSLPSLIYRQSSLSPSPSSSESDLLLDNDLPSFHPNSVLAMRKKSGARFALSSVHVIPSLLSSVASFFGSSLNWVCVYNSHHSCFLFIFICFLDFAVVICLPIIYCEI